MTCLGQCMGAGMFLRALSLASGYFAHNHVLSHATIGSWPAETARILAEKGGSLLAYHEPDPDHMREAVAYRELTALMGTHPKLCRLIDHEHERARATATATEPDVLPATAIALENLSRDPSVFVFDPNLACTGRIMAFLQRTPTVHGALAGPKPVELPKRSALADGHDNPTFKVFVRVRPPLAREARYTRAYNVTQFTTKSGLHGKEIIVSDSAALKTAQTHSSRAPEPKFVFEDVFAEDCSQSDLFVQAVRPLLDAALADGVDATVFAYGQTGSGKTYTIEDGIVPQALGYLTSHVEAVRATYVELHNEVLYDLFSGVNPTLSEVDGAFRLNHAHVITATDTAELLSQYAEAAARRATSGTAMNERSSRSHAVLSVTVPVQHGAHKQRSKVTEVTIHFVDLAGSERLKRSESVGQSRDEAIAINSSLLALARVVHALVTPSHKAVAHVPYRGSLLTKLLSNAIGGRARTVLIACVAPTVDSADETISTLRFATCASLIRNQVDSEAEKKRKQLPTRTALSQDQSTVLSERAASFKADFFSGDPVVVRTELGDMEVYGDFTAGTHAPLCIMLHYYGQGSSGGRQFVPWFDRIRALGYRCLAPSFPGHGRTPGTLSAKPDPEVLAQGPCRWLSTLFDHFGIAKAELYGYDWGAGIGLEFALTQPERVLGVVACCASYRDESRLQLLKQKGFGRKKLCFLGRKNSQVHLWSKTVKQAKAAGVESSLAPTDEDALDAWIAHLQSSRERKSKKKPTMTA